MLSIDDLTRDNYETLIVAAPDFHGRLFGKRIPAARFVQAPNEHPSICTCAMTYDVTEMNQGAAEQIPFAGFHTGWNDFHLRPDVSTLRPYPGVEATAVCLADLVDDEGELLGFAPRALLQHQVERAHDQGYRVLLGSELEFYAFRESARNARARRFHDLEPTTLVHSDHRIGGQVSLEPFLSRVRREMTTAGIPVYATQAEFGLGQWEINLDYADALEMADRHVVYKESLKEMAVQEGLAITFMARPCQNDLGSSCHFHCSLRFADDEPAFASKDNPAQLSATGMAFLGGLMAHRDETALWFAPYVNSYKRHAVHSSGAINAWGRDNRTLGFRVVGSGSSLRIEHRYPGADVNPYLAAAAIIAAGLDGIEKGTDPGPAIVGNAYDHPELPRSPSSLGDAIELFEASEFASEVFGKEVIANYAIHARHEWQAYLSDVTQWEVERAFELA
jgi:glutamine synthetase